MEVAIRRADPSRPGTPNPSSPTSASPAARPRRLHGGFGYVNHDTDGGSIREGNRADLVVLDRNLFDAPDATIADARVEHTLASGRVVYSRA